jgi:hypothetical protein
MSQKSWVQLPCAQPAAATALQTSVHSTEPLSDANCSYDATFPLHMEPQASAPDSHFPRTQPALVPTVPSLHLQAQAGQSSECEHVLEESSPELQPTAVSTKSESENT